MGSPESEPERGNDETQHRVILRRGFWLAETTCTQALWQAVLGENPSQFTGDDRPVERVSWDDVQRFLARLNEAVPDLALRLPTEAEWEYACRAGTTAAFWFGDQITPEQVNYHGRYPYAGGKRGVYRKETVAVQALPCNSWGLYQMHGNVWEWCQDRYGPYPTETVSRPCWPCSRRATACYAAAAGSTTAGSRAQRSASPTTRATATPSSASAWPEVKPVAGERRRRVSGAEETVPDRRSGAESVRHGLQGDRRYHCRLP